MTISSTDNIKYYTGNDVAITLTWDKKIFDGTTFVVKTIVIATGVITTQTKDGAGTYDYAVSVDGDNDGATITLNTILPSTHRATVERILPLTDDTNYTEGDDLPAETVERNFNELLLMIQQIDSKTTNRSFQFADTVSDIGVIAIALNATDRASKVLAFDVNGDLVAETELGTWNGTWATATAYVARDLIKDTNITPPAVYRCNEAHTSTGSLPISSNADSAKWDLVIQDGAVGAQGVNIGHDMLWDDDITDADSGAGKVWFNNATPSSVTVLYMDDVDANAVDIQADVDIWADSTSTTKGQIRVVKKSDPSVFALYNVTGSVTQGSGYAKIGVAHSVSNGTLTDADPVSVSFVRTGDKGDTGSITDINGQTSAVITAADEIIFGDVDDSNNVKKDTVQGILDLVSTGRDLVARNNLALNFFADSVRDAIDRVALENGWIDQLEDLSDIDNGAVEIPMILMDGTNDYLSIAESNFTDGKSFMCHFVLDMATIDDGSDYDLLRSSSGRTHIQRTGGNLLRVFGRNSAVTTIFDVSSTNTITQSDGIVHCLIAFDLASQVIQIVFNGGSVETNQVSTAIANDTWDLNTGGTMHLGGAVQNLKGAIGYFAWWEEYLDLSVAGNVDLFHDGTNIKNIGSNGSTPTGTQPKHFLNNPLATWKNNLGSASNWTENGHLVDAGTITTGASDLDYNATDDTAENSYEIVESYGKENDSSSNNVAVTGIPYDKGGQAINLASDQVIYGIGFPATKNGSPTGNGWCEIHGITGTVGSTAVPDGNIIAKSDTFDVSTLTGTSKVMMFTFAEPIVLTAGDYAFVFALDGGSSGNFVALRSDSTSPTHSGNMVRRSSGSTWGAVSGEDQTFYLYGLKNLDMITVGSDDIGNSPSVAPTTGHLQVIATERPAGWTSDFSDTLNTNATGYATLSVRQRMTVVASGSRWRIRLEGSSVAPLDLDNVSIMKESGSGTYNGVGTITQILFGGSASVIIPTSGSVYSDAFDRGMIAGEVSLITMDISNDAGADDLRVVTTGGEGYAHSSVAANLYNTLTMISGFTKFVGETAVVNLLEVETQQTLDTDIVGQISRDGGSTWDTVALSRTAVQVGGTDMNILKGECTFAATTGTNIVGRIKTANKDKITVHGISPNWV